MWQREEVKNASVVESQIPDAYPHGQYSWKPGAGGYVAPASVPKLKGLPTDPIKFHFCLVTHLPRRPLTDLRVRLGCIIPAARRSTFGRNLFFPLVSYYITVDLSLVSSGTYSVMTNLFKKKIYYLEPGQI